MAARYQQASGKPWDRQPGEGPQAFRAFAAYRDSGANGAKRSLQKTAESLTKSNGAILGRDAERLEPEVVVASAGGCLGR